MINWNFLILHCSKNGNTHSQVIMRKFYEHTVFWWLSIIIFLSIPYHVTPITVLELYYDYYHTHYCDTHYCFELLFNIHFYHNHILVISVIVILINVIIFLWQIKGYQFCDISTWSKTAEWDGVQRADSPLNRNAGGICHTWWTMHDATNHQCGPLWRIIVSQHQF